MSDSQHEEGRGMKTTPWTLDRTINVPLFVTLALAVLGGVAWAGRTDQRIANLEQGVKEIPVMSQQLAEIKAQNTATLRDINRLQGQVDGLK